MRMTALEEYNATRKRKRMISLWQCLFAKNPDGIKHHHIWCSKGHRLGSGFIRKEAVEKNKPLICRACQGCLDFISVEDDNG